MTRLSPASVLAATVCWAAVVHCARADFPTPGGAPGATSGDGTGPFAGLAESPRTSAFSGSAVTKVAIEAPPGRAGATPRLELHYSSSGGASPYGHGWSLPIARIVRSTKRGVPRYQPSDIFVLEASGTSVELEAIVGTKRFQARTEAAFLRIGFDPDHNHWTVIDKSGTAMHFGLAAATRMGPDPTRPDGTWAWLLERTVDAAGNHIDYNYLAPATGEASTSGLPTAVEYGGNLRAGIEHFFSVRFQWTNRTYPSIAPVSYLAGFAQRRDHVLASIETRVDEALVRRYAMSHDLDPVSGALRLVGISLDGFAADSRFDVALPSTVFRYSDPVTTGWPVGPDADRLAAADEMPSPGALRGIGSEIRFDTFDINGDGLVDWIDTRPSTPTVRAGNGFGFAEPAAWPWPARPRVVRKLDTENSNLEVNVFDIDGDGLPDLVDGRSSACQSRRWCVYRNTGAGFETTPILWWAPRNDIRHAHSGGDRVLIDVADLDGDARPDWIDATGYSSDFPYWTVHWNTGDGFEREPFRFRAHRSHISRVREAGTRKQLTYGLFDMNGDALPDFVVADVAANTSPSGPQAHWDVYLNTGSGFAEVPLAWRIEGDTGIVLASLISETDGAPDRSRTFVDLIDMTGDGLPDWLRPWTGADWLAGLEPLACGQQPACTVDGEDVPPSCCFSHLLFVNTGSSFAAPVGWAAWHDFELRDYRDSISDPERQFDVFDIDGDGLVDLVEVDREVWRAFRHPASPLASWSPLPAERRGAANLLLSMMNGVGGETHLQYVAASTFPDNRIPFPYWVVEHRSVRDGITDSPAAASHYVYRGGLWAGDAREFRGFEEVWETDAAGITTATVFRQDDRLRGLAFETTVMGRAPCSPSDPMDESDPCSPLNERLRVDFNAWSSVGPVLLTARTSTPYRNNVAVPELSKQSSYDYDVYGNVVREIVRSPTATTVETQTQYAYAVSDRADGMPDRYLVDRPVHTSTMEQGRSSPLAEKAFAYDAEKPVSGLLEAAATCITWNSTGCARWKTSTYRHDAAGNVVTIIGPRGATTQTSYDDRKLFAREVRDPVGQKTISVRDPRSGRETFRRLPNGRTFETAYDGLGRPVRSWSDEFSFALPEISTSYVDGIPGRSPGKVRTLKYGSAPTTVFYDGIGRVLATKTLVETTTGERAVVDGLRVYAAAGRLTAESVRFEAPEPRVDVLVASAADAPAWTLHIRDPNGRPRQTVLPDGSRTLHDLSRPGVRVTIHPNLAGGTYPGKAEVELLDGLDRTWRRDVCSAPPSDSNPAECPTGTLLERTQYQYDGLDRPTRIMTGAHTPSPAATEFEYDGLGNRTSFTSDDLGTWTYEYGNDGLLTRAVDPRGAVLVNAYDRLGRLRIQRAPEFKARYAYHRRGAGSGLVRRILARSGRSRTRKSFSYDARGRLAKEELRLRAGGPSRRNTTYYGYDDADRRVSITYPSSDAGQSRTVVTAYGHYGKPLSLTAFDASTQTPLVREVGYDLYGNVVLMRYGNGLSDVFGHGPAKRLARLECMRTTGEATTSASCLAEGDDRRRLAIVSRDTAGNILAIHDDLRDAGSERSANASFSYDALGRLVLAEHGGSRTETLSYDALGNLSANTSGSFLYAGTAPHRPTIGADHAIEHDNAGNRTRKGPWSYAYDAMGRLVEVRTAESLRARLYYDEGRTRVARLHAEPASLRYYFAGLFEVEGPTLVRHYHLAGRIVASDVIPAPRGLALAPAYNTRTQQRRRDATDAARIAAVAPAAPPRGAAGTPAELVLLGLIGALTLSAGLRPNRAAVAVIACVTFVVASTPLPNSRRRALGALDAQAAPRSAPPAELFFYHPDHVGSPHLVSDATGAIVEERRYDAYGALRTTWNTNSQPLSRTTTEVGFSGHSSDATTGLLNFGARYYDPELGLFLTPDPQAQFTSPYLYAGGNPINAVDPDGEAVLAFLAAVLSPILISAAVSAFASGIAAGLQGGDFVEAFASGAVVGLAGAALGTVVGGLNVAYQFVAGGSQYIEAAEALNAVVEVALRSSFTSAVSNSVVSFAQATGLSSDWVTSVAVVTPLFASFAYDNYIIKDSGMAAGTSKRELARDAIRRVNTTTGHTSVTAQAVPGTGWEQHLDGLVAANVAQDGPASTGNAATDLLAKARALGGNQDHFGRLPSTIDGIHARIRSALGVLDAPAGLRPPSALAGFVESVGSAAHFVQDHLTLGHMVPGTAMFAGPVGAPIRFIVHQVFGGEIAFRNAQVRATRSLLNRYGPVV